jgi:glyoxylase-like metal-dependent hydrolase (beta-lactamase superfamily II)
MTHFRVKARAGSIAGIMMLLGLVALASPPRAGAQANPWNDSLLEHARALARSVPGERPRSLHVLKIGESSGPLASFVAGADSQVVPVAYPVFQIRYRDRWIVVDAGFDQAAVTEFFGANTRLRFFADRYDRMQEALRGAEHVVLTHEHVDHAIGVQRGPYFPEVAARTLLTEQQIRALLDPPTRAFLRLSADSAAAFPALRYDLLFPLGPGVCPAARMSTTPGAQYVFVQMADGREVLLAADLAWQHEGLETSRQRSEATSMRLGEDRAAVQAQLEWARRILEAGRVTIVLSHDSRWLDSLIARGVLRDGFDLPRREAPR